MKHTHSASVLAGVMLATSIALAQGGGAPPLPPSGQPGDPAPPPPSTTPRPPPPPPSTAQPPPGVGQPPPAYPPGSGPPPGYGYPPPGYGYPPPGYGYPPPGYGYPPPGYGYPPPGYGYAPPPPPDAAALRARTVRTHDGFQLRMGLGVSRLNDTISQTSAPGLGGASVVASGKARGTGLALEVMLGGNVSSQVVLGGGVTFASVEHPTIDGGDTAKVTINYGLIGPYVDWYPDPKGGFHVLLQAGVAMVDVQPDVSFDSSSESTSSSGVGVAPAIGYEWWIGEQWSFGVVGRITFLEATSNRRAFTNVDEKHSIVAPSLLATFVYH